MKAERLKSGAYRCRAYYRTADGVRHAKSFTSRDKAEAIRLAKAFELAHIGPAVEAGSLGPLMRSYIAEKAPQLSPATVVSYENIERKIRAKAPLLYGQPAHSVTASDLQALVNDLSTAGMSPKTLRNYSGFVSAVLLHNGIRPGKVTLPMKRHREITVPTEDDVRALLAAAKGTGVEVAIMLAAFAGLRRGEVCGLRMSDVDLETGRVHVRCDVVMDNKGRWIEKPPKTKASDRFVELPEKAVDLIRSSGKIFEGNPRQLDYAFGCALKRAGIPPFRFHDLRHFCASYMHSLGIPDAYIMQRCGWENDVVLKAVYRHTLADQEQRFADRANAAFSSFL